MSTEKNGTYKNIRVAFNMSLQSRNPTMGIKNSLAVLLRLIQFAVIASILSLAAYTLSDYTHWTEVRYTVAAVSHLN